MTEPEVTVTPRPDAPLEEVLRVDAGSGFTPLEVGAQTKWAFYDWPERQLTNVSHTRIVGTMRYRGDECLEYLDHVIFPDHEQSLSRSLFVVAGETLRQVLFESRESETRGKMEEADATPEPLRLKLGLSWTGHEVYRCGSEERGAGEVHHGLVDGPFAVSVGAGRMLCLRENLWSFGSDGTGHVLAELYVAENGRSIYFRRFNGPAWRNYGELAGCPERDHDGVRWRLWYECLPDISLRR